MVNQKFINYSFFLKSQICQFLGTLIDFKVKVYLILVLSDDLNQLFKSTSNIISIWEFLILTGNQFRFVKAKIGIVPHRIIGGIPVLMCTIQQINVMSKSPPDTWSLSIKNTARQEVQ